MYVRALLIFCSSLISTGLIFAQQSDAHFLTPRIALAVHRSAFVHGYLHGYEEGFHQADFDLHMGRVARGEYSHPDSHTGYHREFGSRHMFNSGFQQGFRVGYADGTSGRSFRAFESVVAAAGTFENAENDRPSSAFDEGMRSGYTAGQHQGLEDAREQRQSKPSPACPVNSGRTQKEFCTAYASGFGMGYSDGFVNQAKTVVEEANK